MDWTTKSLLGMVCLIPIFFIVGGNSYRFGVKPDVTICYWFAPIVLAIAARILLQGREAELLPSTPNMITTVFALTCGAAANVLLFSAVEEASKVANPGIPIAIVASNSVIAFIAAPALARMMPQYIQAPTFLPRDIVFILCTVIGIAGLAIRPPQ